MKGVRRLVPCLATLCLLSLPMAASAGQGNEGSVYGSSSSDHRLAITCESIRGQRVACEADTSRGVLLVEKLSSAACEVHVDWGFDSNGIWVDHGCRAVFEIGGG